MKKIIITATTIASLFLSTSVFANDSLPKGSLNHITKETQQMSAFLDLSKSESDDILNAKITLAKANDKLVKLYGNNTVAYKEARKPHWNKYQSSINSIVSKADQQRYNKSK